MTTTTATAKTPPPPYYAVIFTFARADGNEKEYAKTSTRMRELASATDGFLGMEHATDESGARITVSYWRDLASVKRWRENPEHRQAQKNGKEKWYCQYRIRICRVEREYGKN